MVRLMVFYVLACISPEGDIPSELGRLELLEELSLGSNRLSGDCTPQGRRGPPRYDACYE